MDWIGVSKFASACLCPRSLNYILEVDSNETEIDYERPKSQRKNKSSNADINFGKVAESISQYHASGKSKQDKAKKAGEIRDWIYDLEELFLEDDTLEVVAIDCVGNPWKRDNQWWTAEVKFTEEDVDDIYNYFEQWLRQFNAKGFDNYDWEFEYKIHINRPLDNGNFLPITGVMDLISLDTGHIIELKTTAAWKKDIAKLQVMTYGDLFFVKEGLEPECYVYHDNLLSGCDFNYISELIQLAISENERVNASIQSCRDCSVPRIQCLQRIEVQST
jgi:hypothetical protein